MEEPFPDWAAQEVKNARWEKREEPAASGYILQNDSSKRSMDVQFYERLPDGRYIASLDIPRTVSTENVRNGEPFMFKLRAYESILSPRFQKLLEERYATKMESIWRYELINLEPLQ
jgi:hypothetical protein